MKAPIKTVDDLRMRCDEIGACWEWRGASSPTGTPQCKFNGSHTTAVRVAFALDRGMAIADLVGLTVWPGVCKNQGCIRPQHLMQGTRAQMMVWRGLHGLAKFSPAGKAAVTMARRARGVRFTPAEVDGIRRSPLSELAEAKVHKVSGKLIGRIRRGEIYRDGVAASSIFSMGRP